jgi:hypothetical protein
MLRVAATQETAARNIRWVHGLAEDAPFDGGPFDLVVAGASIQFDEQLANVLQPHATGGVLTYIVQSRIVWGSIRNQPKEA